MQSNFGGDLTDISAGCFTYAIENRPGSRPELLLGIGVVPQSRRSTDSDSAIARKSRRFGMQFDMSNRPDVNTG